MTIDRPLRIALLGTGQYGRGVHLGALRDDPGFQIVSVYSRTHANAQAVADELPGEVRATDDLASIWSDASIEAVDVVLPIPQLASTVRAALASGKHVVSEKPIAATCEDGGALIATWRQDPSRVWMVAENWRYEAAFVHAAKLVKEEAIGRPVVATWAARVPIRPGHRYHGTDWRRTGVVPGGFLQDGGVHYVAALRSILGEVSEARAVASSSYDDLPPLDTLAASLRCASGALVNLTLTFAVGGPWPSELRIAGTEGSLTVERGRNVLRRGDDVQETPFPDYTGVRDELAAFAAAVRDGASHRNSPEEALADLRVIERLLADARRASA